MHEPTYFDLSITKNGKASTLGTRTIDGSSMDLLNLTYIIKLTYGKSQ